MQRRFFTLDVFTAKPFTGNPLAVVLDVEGLDTAAMQRIAAEFNLSETVFLSPPQQAQHRAACRIFTPKRELPFAGHPTVGTAVLLGILDGNARDLVLEEKIGPVRCRVTAADRSGTASFELPKLPEEAGSAPSSDVLASALGLAPGDIGVEGFRPSHWSAGNPLIFVPLKDVDAVARAKPDSARFAELDAPVFVYTAPAADPAHAFRARMFAPMFGIAEDPATGSAAAAFAGLLTRSGRYRDGAHSLVIEQGYEMGRPSLITLGMTIADGRLTSATIGGGAVIVSEGRIEA